ncbi:MAG: ATPase, T2SS/T4P/T4SS family, partial [Verrucomicrobiota bacterium]
MLIGEILIQQGRCSQQVIDEAMARQKSASPPRKLGAILVEENHISEPELMDALGQQFGLDVIDAVTDDMLDETLIQDLPVDWVRSRNVLPIRSEGRLAVLTSDPSRVDDQDDLAMILGDEPVPILATSEVIHKGIEKCYLKKGETASDFIEELEVPEEPVASTSASDDLLRVADEAPVARLVNLILLEALKKDASDIHIEPFLDRLTVRYRIDGMLYEQSSPPKSLEAGLVSRLKVMGHLDIAEKRLPQDGAARVKVGERDVDIRISTVPVVEGERMVLRLLNRESTLYSLDRLGMSPAMVTDFEKLLDEPNGVIWVTGPTGSGKTTTLYAAIQALNTTNNNILTIEDPV